MISVNDGVFFLKTEWYSYLFRVTKYGHLEHIHFGGQVTEQDASVLSCRQGAGWGTTIRYDRNDATSSLDTLPFEWSGSGRGDYRDCPIELENSKGDPIATDFCFDSYRVISGAGPMLCSLPLPNAECETLEITMVSGTLQLKMYWTIYEDVLLRRVTLGNSGNEEVYVRRLMSSCVDLHGNYHAITLNGAWLSEGKMQRLPVGRTKLVNESNTGFSSHFHNPGFLLVESASTENSGKAYGFNLIYSGNHYSSMQRSHQGLTRIVQGISPRHFRQQISAGQQFESPAAVLAFSDSGIWGISQRMHHFVNSAITPSGWRNRPHPVLFDSWEGCGFDVSQDRISKLAEEAGRIGCELFVLDDGWFKGRTGAAVGLGDYIADSTKFPCGLNGVIQVVKNQGMTFGLWLEPESINIDSDLYRAHPDWVIRELGMHDVFGRQSLLLDFAKIEVQDYIVKVVSDLLDEYEIGAVKWDMNRHSTALGSHAHDYVLGLYSVLNRIFGPRPDVFLESSASGGNRFDLGMLCFSHQVWVSDNTDPIERLDIQKGFLSLYPCSVVGANVSAVPQVHCHRVTPMYTRNAVAFFGALGYELDLTQETVNSIEELSTYIAFYKDHKYTFQYGEYCSWNTYESECWQVTGEDEIILGIFHRLVPTAPGYEFFTVKNLDNNQVYRVELLGTPCETFTATGGALMSGIGMPPRFTGLGHTENMRETGDFDSCVYLIQKTV